MAFAQKYRYCNRFAIFATEPFFLPSINNII